MSTLRAFIAAALAAGLLTLPSRCLAQSVNLQGTTPGTPQAGHFNVNGTGIGHLQDQGGQVFNVKNTYWSVAGCNGLPGAVGNGTANDSNAIGCTIGAAAAATPPGVVFFPPGTYNTNGGYGLVNGIRIIGSGVGNTIINITNAANDLFFWDNVGLKNITISDFSVTALDPSTHLPLPRTGGWVINCRSSASLNRSRIANVDVKDQVNGFCLSGYNFVWIDNVMMSAFVAATDDGGAGTTGIGIQAGYLSAVNQGAELMMAGVRVVSQDFDSGQGATNGHLQYGMVIADAQAVYGTDCVFGGAIYNNLRIGGNAGSGNHFFSICAFDTTYNGDNVRLTGPSIASVTFDGCWFANGGTKGATGTQNGIRVDATALVYLTISNSRIFFNQGTGLYLKGSCAGCTIAGNALGQNGLRNQPENPPTEPSTRDAIYVDLVGAGYRGPAITGNADAWAYGKSLRASAASYNYVLVGNQLPSGYAWTTPPAVNTGNQFN